MKITFKSRIHRIHHLCWFSQRKCDSTNVKASTQSRGSGHIFPLPARWAFVQGRLADGITPQNQHEDGCLRVTVTLTGDSPQVEATVTLSSPPNHPRGTQVSDTAGLNLPYREAVPTSSADGLCVTRAPAAHQCRGDKIGRFTDKLHWGGWGWSLSIRRTAPLTKLPA